MTTPTMTPTEAADLVDDTTAISANRSGFTTAVRVLVDHARSTAAPGDLAEALDDLLGVSRRIEGGETTIDVSIAARVELAILSLRAHRCPPAPEVAECPVEIVTGEQAAKLPDGSRYVPCDEDGIPFLDALVKDPAVTGLGLGDHYRVLYRAPEPVPPPAVGDEIRDRATLDRLPVGTVLRVGYSFTIAVRSVNGWSQNQEPLDPDRLIGYTVVHGVGRVIDLPKAAEA